MKMLLAVLALSCLLTACPKNNTPPLSTAQVPPKSAQEFRLSFAYPPYSVESPQIRKIPKSGQPALTRVRASLTVADPAEKLDPEHLPMAYVYQLQGAEGGAWQSLGLVDGLGRFVTAEQGERGVKLVPRFADEQATQVLREQIEVMSLGRVESLEPAGRNVLPPEGLPIEGRPGFMRSPYDPQGRPIDVRGLPKRTEVEDPYNPGKTIVVP